jgi:RNA-directed DNA polymerase
MSLPTPSTVEKLQTSLQTKAKTEPAFRFYSLWDKVCRSDVLAEAWRRCRANAGAAGVDGETFEQIESQGIDGWLETLREELMSGQYAPQPLLRVWIPKSNGGQRPLGIPTVLS